MSWLSARLFRGTRAYVSTSGRVGVSVRLPGGLRVGTSGRLPRRRRPSRPVRPSRH